MHVFYHFVSPSLEVNCKLSTSPKMISKDDGVYWIYVHLSNPKQHIFRTKCSTSGRKACQNRYFSFHIFCMLWISIFASTKIAKKTGMLLLPSCETLDSKNQSWSLLSNNQNCMKSDVSEKTVACQTSKLYLLNFKLF